MNLVYNTDVSPLTLSMVGDRVLTRLHTLSTVNVLSEATCPTVAGHTILTDGVVLESYHFNYADDPDTRQTLMRLQSVTLTGQAGTNEATVTLPVATYTYGTATTAPTSTTPLKLTYQQDPTFGGLANYGKTVQDESIAKPLHGVGYSSVNPLLDIKGTGIPAKNAALKTETRTTTLTRFNGADGPGFVNADLVWRKVMDVNGDGRMDIIDASETAHTWAVYLNDGNADSTLWPRREIATDTLAQYLRDRGIAVDANYMPLSQRRTNTDNIRAECFIFRHTQFNNFWDVYPDPDFGDTGTCNPPPPTESQSTITEWELTDLNGDGYPDVVFNSSPVIITDSLEPFPSNPSIGQVFFQHTTTAQSLRDGTNNRIDAVFNVLGTHLAKDSANQPFSAPVTLRNNDSCGVEQWSGQAVGSDHRPSARYRVR